MQWIQLVVCSKYSDSDDEANDRDGADDRSNKPSYFEDQELIKTE